MYLELAKCLFLCDVCDAYNAFLGMASFPHEDVIFTSESSVIYWVVGLFLVILAVVFLNVFEKVICNSVILCKMHCLCSRRVWTGHSV